MISPVEPNAGNATLTRIELLARDYAEQRNQLRLFLIEVSQAISALMRTRQKKFQALTAAEAEKKSLLTAAVAAAPELFKKPKSLTLHGIKVGYRKGSGGLVWEDEEQVLRRIHKMFPDEAANAYLHITERPNKETLEALAAAELKKLGIEIEAAGDLPFVKPVQNDLEKYAALLLNAEADTEEAK